MEVKKFRMFNLEKKIQRNMISSVYAFKLDTILPPAEGQGDYTPSLVPK